MAAPASADITSIIAQADKVTVLRLIGGVSLHARVILHVLGIQKLVMQPTVQAILEVMSLESRAVQEVGYGCDSDDDISDDEPEPAEECEDCEAEVDASDNHSIPLSKYEDMLRDALRDAAESFNAEFASWNVADVIVLVLCSGCYLSSVSVFVSADSVHQWQLLQEKSIYKDLAFVRWLSLGFKLPMSIDPTQASIQFIRAASAGCMCRARNITSIVSSATEQKSSDSQVAFLVSACVRNAKLLTIGEVQTAFLEIQSISRTSWFTEALQAVLLNNWSSP